MTRRDGGERKAAQVVVVTGASAGVGRAVARAFGRRRARVALIARGSGRLEEARREIESLGGRAAAIRADTADSERLEEAAEEVERTLGPIDIWINNAMVTVFAPFKEITPEEFRRVTDVSYLGFVYGTMVALKRMLPRDRGVIVQIGSALAGRSIPLQSAYCGAKHAVRGFTDSIRTELIHDQSHVHITMVQLPAVNTPQFGWSRSRMPRKAQPVPPIYQPEVIGEAVYWAAHHRRRELDIGWSTVKAMNGNKLFPGLLDRYLGQHGYESQMTEEPEDPGRPDNLYEPVLRDAGARGAFSERARDRSWELWVDEHRRLLSVTALSAVGAVLLWPIRGRFARRKGADGNESE